MPRRGFIAKRDVLPDPIYNSKVVTKLVNNIMLDGKKSIAQKIVYDAFDIIKEKEQKDPLEVFEAALENIMPVLEVKARRIEIYNIKLIKIDEKEKQIFFRVSCSKGTYIRTLCENIAEKLGTVGYMKELNRTKVGDCKIEDSIKVKELEENILKHNLSKIITIEELFKEKEKVELTDNEIKKYLNGVQIPVNEIYSKTNNNNNEEICRVYYKNKFIGLGVIKNEKLKRDIVIQ